MSITDVLREFALACEDAGNAGPEVERIVAEYATKLRLAESEDLMGNGDSGCVHGSSVKLADLYGIWKEQK